MMQEGASRGGERPLSVTVVTVTYGDRMHLLEQVLEAVGALDRNDAITSVLVVDNGTPPQTRERLRALAATCPRLRVLRSGSNLGSAGGYALGLSEAFTSDATHVWLIDDDNRPEPDALVRLLEAAREHPKAALLALRTDRPQLIALAEGTADTSVFGRPNSFLGFSVTSLPSKIRARFCPTGAPTRSTRSRHPVIPFAPYGGLFAPRQILAAIGLPRTDFYLYGDDHEYTFRLTQNGISILLVPLSRLVDVDRSWNQDVSSSSTFISPYLRRHLDGMTLRRLYFYVRNRAYFETRMLSSGPEYWLNVAFYLSLLCFTALVGSVVTLSLSPIRSLLTVLRGAGDGFLGRLGPRQGIA